MDIPFADDVLLISLFLQGEICYFATHSNLRIDDAHWVTLYIVVVSDFNAPLLDYRMVFFLHGDNSF